jgi:hypothetical protein
MILNSCKLMVRFMRGCHWGWQLVLLTRVLQRNIGIQFTFKLLIFKLFLCCFYSWRLVCTLTIFFFCKRPKLENLIYITFVHVSLISLKLKISSAIIITEGEKNSMCKLSRQVNCRNVWIHILSLYKKERKKERRICYVGIQMLGLKLNNWTTLV